MLCTGAGCSAGDPSAALQAAAAGARLTRGEHSVANHNHSRQLTASHSHTALSALEHSARNNQLVLIIAFGAAGCIGCNVMITTGRRSRTFLVQTASGGPARTCNERRGRGTKGRIALCAVDAREAAAAFLRRGAKMARHDVRWEARELYARSYHQCGHVDARRCRACLRLSSARCGAEEVRARVRHQRRRRRGRLREAGLLVAHSTPRLQRTQGTVTTPQNPASVAAPPHTPAAAVGCCAV